MLGKRRNILRRKVAWVLTMCMLVGMCPQSIMAQRGDAVAFGEESETITLVSFEELAEKTASQEVAAGTSMSRLDLPKKLKARQQMASPSDADFVDVKVERWESDPLYDDSEDAEAGSEYVFTPVFDEIYDVSEANVPEIVVTIAESEDAEDAEEDAEDDADLATDSNAEEILATDSNASKRMRILSWEFVDPENYLNEGHLALIGVNKDMQADFDTVVSMLPKEILAEVEREDAADIEDAEDIEDTEIKEAAVEIASWSCAEYVQTEQEDETLSWPLNGEYVFTAELDENYSCQPEPVVKVLVGEASVLFSGGDGTEGNPYLISTLADLNVLSQEVNAGNEQYANAYYKMTDDITVNADFEPNLPSAYAKRPAPIGYYYYYNDYDSAEKIFSRPFKGHFDGQGFAVIGLCSDISAAAEGPACQGLFGYVGQGAEVKNVGIENSYIKSGQSPEGASTEIFTGGIAGYCEGDISGCYTDADTIIVGGGTAAGGIVGKLGNDTSNSTSDASVSRCYNRAAVTNNPSGKNQSFVAGIVGEIATNDRDNVIINCYNEGTIIAGGTGNTQAGGIVGYCTQGTIESCYNTGDITSNSSYAAGISAQEPYVLKNVRSLGARIETGSTSEKYATSYRGRVFGNANTSDKHTSATNSYGRSDMLLITLKTQRLESSLDWASKNGEDCTVTPPATVDCGWEGFDTSVWNIDASNEKLPTLRDLGGDQNPSIPKSMVYPVNVGGVVITESNLEDVLGDKKVSYDPETNTLTLDSVVLGTSKGSYQSVNGLKSVVGIYSSGDLNLVISGTNTITVPDTAWANESSYGIFAQGNLNISGTGSINATGGTTADGSEPYSAGIAAGGILTIESGKVTGFGQGSRNGAGLKAKAVIIKDGDVDAQTDAYNSGYNVAGIIVETQIQMDGGKLLAGCDSSVGQALSVRPTLAAGSTIRAGEKGDLQLITNPNAFWHTAKYAKVEINPAMADYAWYLQNPDAAEFHITRAGELYAFARLVSGTVPAELNIQYGVPFPGKTIYLDENIDLAGLDSDEDTENGNWTPITAGQGPFVGTLNGNGHTISNLTSIINDGAAGNGLFATIGDAGSVKNLVMDNVIIRGGERAGAIAGTNECIVDNCQVTGESEISGALYAGGIVGKLEGLVTDCVNEAAVTGILYAGGIVGKTSYTNTQITGCANGGAVSAADCVGGIAGEVIDGGKIAQCVNTASVSQSSDVIGTAEPRNSVGGIVGNAKGARNMLVNISNCYQTGAVSANGHTGESWDLPSVGGIAGKLNCAAVEKCYSTGTVSWDVTAPKTVNAGGIAGTINNSATDGIKDSVALGTTIEGTGAEKPKAGRIFGGESTTKNLSNNRARNDMIINGAGVTGGKETDKNGGDLAIGTTQDWMTWLNMSDSETWSIPNGELKAGCELPILRKLPSGVDQSSTLPKQTVAAPPTLSTATYELPDKTAKTATFTLTNGPADSYGLYTAETAGSTVTEPALSVSGSTVTLTYTTAPTAPQEYWLSAQITGGPESARTKLTVKPSIGTECDVLEYETNFTGGGNTTGTIDKKDEANLKMGLTLWHALRAANANGEWIGNLPIKLQVSTGATVTSNSVALEKKTIEGVEYWTGTYNFDDSAEITFTVVSEDKLKTATYTATASIRTYTVGYKTATNITPDEKNPKSVDWEEKYSVSFTAAEGYTQKDIKIGNDTVTTAGIKDKYEFTYEPTTRTSTLTVLSAGGDVIITPKAYNSAAELTDFKIANQVRNTVSDGKITIEMPAKTNLAALKPTFTVSGGAKVTVNNNEVTSGTTSLDFKAAANNTLVFKVTAEDGTTTKDYPVTVTVPSYAVGYTLTNIKADAGRKASAELHEALTVKLETETGFTVPAATDTTNLKVTMQNEKKEDVTLAAGTGYIYTPATDRASATITIAKVTGAVSITVKALRAAKEITGFQVEKQIGETVINQKEHTIVVEMAYGTALTALQPVVTLTKDSEATVSPASQAAKDFSDSVKNPVIYTVTAENGDTQEYKVTVKIPSYKLESTLTNQTVTSLTQKTVALHQPLDLTLVAKSEYGMPAVTDTKNLVVTMKDANGTAKTLTAGSDYEYKITLASPSTATLKIAKGKVTGDVSITVKALNQRKAITAFAVDKQVGAAVIDEKEHTIEVQMPHGTDLKTIKPTVTPSPDAKVVPASGAVTDFSNSEKTPVVYTVTAEDGSTQKYDVTVKIPSYGVGYTLTNVADAARKEKVNLHEELNVVLTAKTGFTVPPQTDTDNLKVTMKDLKLTEKVLVAGTDYTYTVDKDRAAGTITIKQVTGAVQITLKALNTEKSITEFAIDNQVGETVLDQKNHTIAIEMPYQTKLAELKPVVTLASNSNATVNPASGAVSDFSDSVKNPVIYTVTAENGDTQEYEVTVQIPSYKVDYDLTYMTADQQPEKMELKQPLEVTLTAEEGYSVQRKVTITVTEDGTSHTLADGTDYTYTPDQEKDTASIKFAKDLPAAGDVLVKAVGESRTKQITEFTVEKQVGDTVLEEKEGKISLIVPYGTELKTIAPTIKATDSNASVNPESGKAVDFTNSRTTPVKYTVTAEDDSTKEYLVTITYPTVKVTFDSNGGASVEPQELTAGELAKKPTDPMKETDGTAYYAFDGWYLDQALTRAYAFSDLVTTDVTLYAKWRAGYKVITTAENGTVEITGGDGTGIFYPGETVTAKATAAGGYQFKDWSASEQAALLADVKAQETTFLMPAGTVKLTATFAKRSSGGGGGGGGSTSGGSTAGGSTAGSGTVNVGTITTTPTENGGTVDEVKIDGSAGTTADVRVIKDAAGNVISRDTQISVKAPQVSVEGNKAAMTIQADSNIVLQAAKTSGATAQNPMNVTIPVSSVSMTPQLQNPQISTVEMNVVIPSAVTKSADVRVGGLILEKAVLEATRESGKSITVAVKNELGVEQFSWTVDGAELKGSQTALTDVNLAIDATPTAALTETDKALRSAARAVSADGLVLNFRHSGMLPTTASIHISSIVQRTDGITSGITAGSKVYVYSYNKLTGKLERVENEPRQVDAQGYVTLAVKNAATYVLIPAEKISQAVPAEKAAQTGNAAQSKQTQSENTHVIQQGDNLWKIANQYGCSIADLRAANPNIDESDLRIGQNLNVPKK